MKLDKTIHDPGEVLEFYEQALTALGALCERTWHDKLEVVAEGAAARLWNANASLHEIELRFVSADAAAARDAGREVFPGCPLTFQLAEALRPAPLPLEKFILDEAVAPRMPDVSTAERLWSAQFPETARWKLLKAFQPEFHFSLIALARCEIQAMDQHWSIHRICVSLPDGAADETLAGEIGFAHAGAKDAPQIEWPKLGLDGIRGFLSAALQHAVAGELTEILARQQKSLQREFDRIDDYFENYERELSARAGRSTTENSKIKIADRLAATKAEHARRRADQLARHEVRVQPLVDSLLMVAEKAWRTRVEVLRDHKTEQLDALYVPRNRRWIRLAELPIRPA